MRNDKDRNYHYSVNDPLERYNKPLNCTDWSKEPPYYEKERYTLKEYDNYHYAAFDNDKPMIHLQMKAFGTYACFHKIIDKLNEQDNRINELTDENDYLKKKLNLLIEYDQKMYEEVIFKSEDGDIILYKKRGDFNG